MRCVVPHPWRTCTPAPGTVASFPLDHQPHRRTCGRYALTEEREAAVVLNHMSGRRWTRRSSLTLSGTHDTRQRAKSDAKSPDSPVDLPLRTISAGCPPGGVVLDPFSGAATARVQRRPILGGLINEYSPAA